MTHQFRASYLEDTVARMRNYKLLAEQAMADLTEEQMQARLDPGSNSIAQIMKHLAGNMRSRFTGFILTDGEKPDRNRPSEFVEPPPTRKEAFLLWEEGWRRVFAAIESLGDQDMERTVLVRGEPHSVMQAINRELAHYAYHCGQIILLAKHLRAEKWTPLSGR